MFVSVNQYRSTSGIVWSSLSRTHRSHRADTHTAVSRRTQREEVKPQRGSSVRQVGSCVTGRKDNICLISPHRHMARKKIQLLLGIF